MKKVVVLVFIIFIIIPLQAQNQIRTDKEVVIIESEYSDPLEIKEVQVTYRHSEGAYYMKHYKVCYPWIPINVVGIKFEGENDFIKVNISVSSLGMDSEMMQANARMLGQQTRKSMLVKKLFESGYCGYFKVSGTTYAF